MKYIGLVSCFLFLVSCGDPAANRPTLKKEDPVRDTDADSVISIGTWISNKCENVRTNLQTFGDDESKPNASMRKEIRIESGQDMEIREIYYAKIDCPKESLISYTVSTYYVLKTPEKLKEEINEDAKAINLHVTDVQVRIFRATALELANDKDLKFLTKKDWEINRAQRLEDKLRNDIKDNTTKKTALKEQIVEELYRIRDGVLYFGKDDNSGERPTKIDESITYTLTK